MSQKYKTDQEEFWAGDFGNDYCARNTGPEWIASNVALFSKILGRCEKIESIIEFGSNVGLNIKALRVLLPNTDITAVEINEKAVRELKKISGLQKVHHCTIFNYPPPLRKI